MTDHSIFENKTAAYYTLGCKLNFAETSHIGRSLLAQGVRTAREGEHADICVINTCSVTELADKKCRYMIRKAHREHPGAFVVVTGCYAQLSPEEVAQIDGVNLVLGSEQKLDVVHYLSRLELDLEQAQTITTATKDIDQFQISSSSDQRTRHYLKVQDGCDYHCTYCTIPKARGRSRNGSIEEIVREARRIEQSGGLEIVLTGVNIGDFGRSTGESFLDLLRALDQVSGIERYRIGSIEPNLLTEEIIDFCAESRRIAPHFHIPLQSGSDDVLKLMRRRYDTALFSSRVSYIRERLPKAFIGVDVIVGTRGELLEYYQACVNYLTALDCSQLHVFSYSERSGTMALRIPHSVDPREKHKRSQRLQRLSEEKLKAFYENNIGREMRVIWEEGNDNGWMTGYSDNYVRVGRPYEADRVGSIDTVRTTALSDTGLFLI
ncbi:MAG: tRNA (N(6)-L-threonylcarbamoyladenosine(37)-C(2))-methylthiotransferase MtaB [Porphyromonadaceae bacterium]|nr:tRNA (N(6)-L-threonylcarbamoyladenosine(37)-C(2))-methylthiotransferase MtaB [Porphyromonadaceae bacterium]